MRSTLGTVPFEALFGDAPVGFAFFDRELRYVRVNEKLAEINGVPAEEHVGRTIPDIVPGMEPGIVDAFQHVLDTGEPLVGGEFIGATPASEHERRFSASVYPVRDEHGVPIGLGCIAFDVTDRHEAEEGRRRALELERVARAEAEAAAGRARFLAEASVVLDESLDYDATLTSVSRLAVPWIADWCAIDIRDPDGTLRRVTTAHVDPAKVELAHEVERRYPSATEGDVGVPGVLASGRSELYPEIPDELLAEGAQDEEHLKLLRELGLRSVMIVPMIARGRTLGAITFVAAETERAFGDDDLLLAEELARRAAMSVDNARLYGERAYIARTLQESLLPPHLPRIAGLELAGLYRPAGEGNEVGGDFYDVFELDGDNYAAVIGDVCGKGAAAAALTALVRYTIRAIASPDVPPSETLKRLNEAILRQRSDGRFCTVAYALLTRTGDGVRVQVASGGHPLPLVARHSSCTELVGTPGTLLGVVADPAIHDHTLELREGDTFVLYTDGITEAGAPQHLMETDELAQVIAGCESRAAIDVASCLEGAAVAASGGHPHDDIALVVLHVPDATGRVSAPAGVG